MDTTISLSEIAHARSGDKGNHANIGIVAFTQHGFEFLRGELTESRVADYFAELNPSKVERFELPGIGALNFLLHNVLGGGGSQSMFIDTQGKTLGLICLQMRIPRPDELSRMTADER